MKVFGESTWERRKHQIASIAAGAFAGFGIGLLLSRLKTRPRGLAAELQQRAGSVARRLRPARLRRLALEQQELDRLENAVLDAFLADDILARRAVDIGAISLGIIELSGPVSTDGEARRAVAVANGVPGVRTVINRLEVQQAARPKAQRRLDAADLEGTFAHQEARVGGMGRRRQSVLTEPDRPDDSQARRERSLATADRDQFADEGYTRPSAGARSEGRPPQTNFAEDELDNQDPHG